MTINTLDSYQSDFLKLLMDRLSATEKDELLELLKKDKKQRGKLKNKGIPKVSDAKGDCEILKNLETHHNLEYDREKWKEKIKLDRETKEKIIQVVENISVDVVDNDEGRLIKFRLGDKTYKILDSRHLNNYKDRGNWGIKLRCIRGNNIDKWTNQKVKDYVLFEQLEGLHIATVYEMKELLERLGELAGFSDMNKQISMFMYLIGTGFEIADGYRLESDSKYERPILSCNYFGENGLSYTKIGNRTANLCMMNCE